MADMFEQLLQHLGTGTELEQISNVLGADAATTQLGIAAALPSLLGALASNAESPDGAQSLFRALDDHDSTAVDNVQGLLGGLGGNGAANVIGEKILGHVFGSNKETAESAVAQKSGLNANLVKQLLPILAPIVMSYLGKKKSQEGFGLDDLVSILINEKTKTVEKEPGLGGLLDAVTGGGAGGALGGLLGGNDSPLGSILGKVLGG